MARISACVFSAFFFLAVGLASCASNGKECTKKNIWACNFYNENDCPFSKKNLKCLQQIDASTCATDELSRRLEFQTARAYNGSVACPGLDDGICYFNVMNPCDKDIPYELIIYRDVKEDEIKQKCAEFKDKAETTKACFRALMPKCEAEYPLKQFKKGIDYVERIQALCGKVKNA